MQFSIRLILLLTAYVALVVSAFASAQVWVAHLVWVGTVLAIAYTAVLAFVSHGKRQAMAMGFVILALAYLAVLYLQPNQTLTVQVYSLAGYKFTGHGLVLTTPEPGVTSSSPGARAGAPALDAASTLAAGFIGCGLGALAYRQGSGEETANAK